METHENRTNRCVRLRQAAIEFLMSREFTYFPTFNFNRTTTLEEGRRKIREWHARFDRKLLGSKWSKTPEAERTFFIGFPEHLESNLHYHMLLVPAVPMQPFKFKILANSIWTSPNLVPSGDVHVEPIISEEDQENVARYITKDAVKESHWDKFIISNEFIGR